MTTIVLDEFSQQHALVSRIKSLCRGFESKGKFDRFEEQQALISKAGIHPNPCNALLPASIVVDANYCSPVDTFCSACEYILRGSSILDRYARNSAFAGETGSERWPHHPNIESVHRSANKGCHLCSLLYLQGTSAQGTTFPTDGLHLRVDMKDDYHSFQIGIEDCQGSIDSTYLGLQAAFPSRIIGDNASAWRTFSTSSELTFALASEWLTNCVREHKVCNAQGVFPIGGPKRLLLISGTGEQLSVRLVDHPVNQHSVQYVTLSHCWGGEPALILQTDNIPSFHKGMASVALPRTFRDAVSITYRLGFTYLWIDALCIVQDSEAEKKVEIPRMGIIYGNSICTIAAMSSTNTTMGCYAERLPLCQIPCHVHAKSGKTIALSCPRAEGLREDVYPDTSMGYFDGPALFQRGWVVQERALSPRTLYFSRQGIQWECCVTILSESDVWKPNREPFEPGRLKSGIAKILRRSDMSLACVDANAWHHQWWHLVRLLTRCLLSHISDRWPAISGIAQMFVKLVGPHLVAGMWRHMLYRDMLWEIGGMSSSNRSRNRLNNGYPTWSWLSVDSRVFLDEQVLSLPSENCVVEFLNLPNCPQMTPSNLCSPLNSGKKEFGLTIRAPAIRLPKPSEGGVKDIEKSRSNLREIVFWRLSNGDWRLDVGWHSIDLDDSNGHLELKEKYELWAFQWTREQEGVARFLIIHPTCEKENSWERVGTAIFEPYKWSSYVSDNDCTMDEGIGPKKTINLY